MRSDVMLNVHANNHTHVHSKTASAQENNLVLEKTVNAHCVPKIYGNSVQETSVQSANILDLTKLTLQNNNVVNLVVNVVKENEIKFTFSGFNASWVCFKYKLNFKENGNYFWCGQPGNENVGTNSDSYNRIYGYIGIKRYDKGTLNNAVNYENGSFGAAKTMYYKSFPVNIALYDYYLFFYPTCANSTNTQITAHYNNLAITKTSSLTNIFDGQMEQGYIDSTTGLNVIDSTKTRSKNYSAVNRNSYYYINTSGTVDPATGITCRWYDINKSYITSSPGFGTSNPNVIQAPANAKYLKFVDYSNLLTNTYLICNADYVAFVPNKPSVDYPSNILNHGTYNSTTGKYEVKPLSNSRNRLNATSITQVSNGITTITQNNKMTCNGTATVSWFDFQNTSNKIPIKLKANENYVFSIKESIQYDILACIFYEDETMLLDAFKISAGNTFKNFTPIKNVNYIRFFVNNIPVGTTLNNYIVEDLKIEKGLISTSYEPYRSSTITFPLDEPLRALEVTSSDNYNLVFNGYGGGTCGDNFASSLVFPVKNGKYYIADYVDWGNKKVIRRIKSVILNGTNTYFRSNTETSGKYRFYTNLLDCYAEPNVDKIAILLSDKFEPITRTNTYSCTEGISYLPASGYGTGAGLVLYIDTTKAMSISEFTTWITSNPITVNYLLATPTETPFTSEQLAVANLYTTPNHCNISVDSEVPPLQLDIDYLEMGV